MKRWATLLYLLIISIQVLYADDWPMWRYDSYRSACSREKLPDSLKLQWSRQYSPRKQVWDDPMNNDKMTYDKVFEPVIMGNKLFINFNDSDKVVALDLNSGKEIWRFYTDGPVRLAPVACKGKVYITSDDGYLYCVSAETGKLIWKFRGGPSAQKVIGNKRIISMWPARGGPVIRDGYVYFTASIWPFVGTFIYALDAETGKVAWLNDRTGPQFIRQPHEAYSFAGVAPQGALVATSEILLVPGGRSVPAALERKTGKFIHFHINDGGKGTGGSFVAATEKEYLVHTHRQEVRPFDLMSGRPAVYGETNKISQTSPPGKKGEKVKPKSPMRIRGLNRPVLSDDVIYTSTGNAVRALDRDMKDLWSVRANGNGGLIKAGNRLYAAGLKEISVIELSDKRKPGTVVRTIPVKGQVLRLLAGNGKLVAVTLEGSILVFGDSAMVGSVVEEKKTSLPRHSDYEQMVADILKHSAGYEGYGLCFGVDDGKLLDELLNQSSLHITAVDPDKQKVDKLRIRYDKAGLYGKRISLHQGTPADFKAPSYIANLIVVGKASAKACSGKDIIEKRYRYVRPYGGALWQPLSIVSSYGQVKKVAGGTMLFRNGALEGSADWTHNYADAANTLKSNDERVKLPLGILWFGGNSHVDVLPRHAHGPGELVAGGRLFVEGMDSLSARDVYTGRVMWKRKFDGLNTYGIYYTYKYKGDPLGLAYAGQGHYPGANLRGSNYAVTEDRVYLVMENLCHVLDAATGKTVNTIIIPDENGQKRNWGFIGVYKDVLLAGAGFANYSKEYKGSVKRKKTDYPALEDLSASKGLIAFDRHTGKKLWSIKADYAFYHNGIVAGGGRVYCLDRFPESVEEHLRRRGETSSEMYRVAAFDINSGKRIWQTTNHVFGSWLAYSEEHDILFQGGAAAIDRGSIEVRKGMITLKGKTGDILWKKPDQEYYGPCVLYNDILITNPNQHGLSEGAFSLLDGSEVKITNPINGKKEPWQIKKGKGCDHIIASENMLTYREGAAAYYDLKNITGTGSFGGFKSGCSAALIAASGVLNAPDYTRTCTCAYQNQTSMAMIHMPEVETWTHSQFASERSAHGAIKRLGINFGAPGDRMAENGTLWIDMPAAGGISPLLEIKTDRNRNYYYRHSSVVGSSLYSWIVSSGIKNAGAITIRLATWPRKVASKHKSKEEKSTAKKNPVAKEPEKVSAKDKVRIVQGAEGSYTIRLYFAESENKQSGERVFDVSIQGQTVLKDLDIAKETGGQWKELIKEFKNVQLKDDLRISLTPKEGSETLLSGVEIIRE
ncbi:PQQ-binding-like beta-propeller repeat protein [Verrucomicrobiota bacterium]